MGVAPGTRLGPYEIAAPLGAGGMGEVYKARDTRLDRTVAIKILPEHLSSNGDLKQRFDREARTISSLQHAHICTLFDIGSQNGSAFLVMEYLEGETLAQRLEHGAIRVEEALKIGVQIADALDKAHRAGIVHRDLKPGNIMLTKSGARLMDFGLAKPALAMGTAASSGAAATNTPTVSITALAAPASPITQQGTIVGTFQYIAPEVLQGAEADARSDIFSMGCVLYEMVTGHRAFDGKSQLSVMTAILEKDPEPFAATKAQAAGQLEPVVFACLAKDPERRLQCAADVRRALEWTHPQTRPKAVPNRSIGSKWFVALAAAVLAVAVFALWFGYFWGARNIRATTVQAEIPPPPGHAFVANDDNGGMPVLSPQGDKVAFVAKNATGPQSLWVRALNSSEAQPLAGTDGAVQPFWSPEGSEIGFFSNGKLNKIAAAGGPVTALADAPNPRGGTWGTGGVIVFAANFQSALSRVSATGGPMSAATTLDRTKHTTHRWPWFLPDGKHFVFLATSHDQSSFKDNGIFFGSLDSTDSRMVVASDAGAEFAGGYLLFHSQDALVAQAFDPATGKLSGAAVPVLSDIRFDSGIWRAIFDVSQNGILIYQAANANSASSHLAWVDRSGTMLSELTELKRFGMLADPQLSPDGRRVAFAAGDHAYEIWVLDLQRKTQSRITFDSGTATEPAWFPNGTNLVFKVDVGLGGDTAEIRTKPADGSGAERTLTTRAHAYQFPGISPDGKYLTYIFGPGNVNRALWAMPLEGDRKPFVVVQPPSAQSSVYTYRISPDGKWVAYVSDETGQNQLFVTTFPDGKGKWQVSTGIAAYPVWRKDGKELYFKDLGDTYYACPVATDGTAIDIGTPQRLFHAANPGSGAWYDVSADGKRFLMNLAQEDSHAPLNLIVNWQAELKK